MRLLWGVMDCLWDLWPHLPHSCPLAYPNSYFLKETSCCTPLPLPLHCQG